MKLKVNASFECKKGEKSLFKRIERSIVEKRRGKVGVVNSRDVSILSVSSGEEDEKLNGICRISIRVSVCVQ